MRFPLNTIHWYLALPFLILIAYRSFRARGGGRNMLNTYFGLSAITFILSMLCYGLPPLVASPESMLLTYGVIAGDIFQFIALLWVWLAVARIYFPGKKSAFWVFLVLDCMVVLAGAYYSVTENFAQPVTMQSVDGVWQINFVFTQGYQIIAAIQFASLVFLAVQFFLQAKEAAKVEKKIRLFSLATFFFLVGGVYALRPVFNLNITDNSASTLLSGAYIVIALMILVSLYLAMMAKRSK